jgi:hypothetical protein
VKWLLEKPASFNRCDVFCVRKEGRADGTAGAARRMRHFRLQFSTSFARYINGSAERTGERLRSFVGYVPLTEARCIWPREQISPDQSVAPLPVDFVFFPIRLCSPGHPYPSHRRVQESVYHGPAVGTWATVCGLSFLRRGQPF